MYRICLSVSSLSCYIERKPFYLTKSPDPGLKLFENFTDAAVSQLQSCDGHGPWPISILLKRVLSVPLIRRVDEPSSNVSVVARTRSQP